MQISGELAEIYSQMPQDQARKYEAFRKLVFARFGISAEHFRRKFRSLTKKPEESYSQLGHNLVRYLEKWLEQVNVETLGYEKYYRARTILFGFAWRTKIFSEGQTAQNCSTN